MERLILSTYTLVIVSVRSNNPKRIEEYVERVKKIIKGLEEIGVALLISKQR